MNVLNALTTYYRKHTAVFFSCVFCAVMMLLRTSKKVKKVILCAIAFTGAGLVFLHPNIFTIVPSSNTPPRTLAPPSPLADFNQIRRQSYDHADFNTYAKHDSQFNIRVSDRSRSVTVSKTSNFAAGTLFSEDSASVPAAKEIANVFPSNDNVDTENRVKTSVAGPVNSTLSGRPATHERIDISEKIPLRSNASVDSAGESRQKRRTILYACRIAECGGWADRQKGVVSAFVLSVLLDRDFKLDMPRPCDVSVFMLPDQVNWTLAPNETHGKTTKKLFGWTQAIAGLMDEVKKLGDFKIPSLDADYVFITWNLEMVNLLQKNALARRVPWLDLKFSVAEIYNHVLRKLFKPVPDLRAKMSDLQRSRPPHTKLVCAQVRMGLSQHFDEEKQAKFNTMDSLPVLWKFLRQFNDSANYRIFFASDNKDMMHLAKEKFPTVFLSTSGPVTHLDKYTGPGDNACAGFGHTILDQMVLSTCYVLIMSRSGFGKVASFLRNTDQGLFLFHQSKIVPFLPNQDFADRVW